MSSDKDLKTQYLELEQPQRRDEIVRLVERIQTIVGDNRAVAFEITTGFDLIG